MRKILTLTMSGLVTALLAGPDRICDLVAGEYGRGLAAALIAYGWSVPSIIGQAWDRLRVFCCCFRRRCGERHAGKILLKYWNDFLGRIPFVKTLAGGFRDVLSLLPVRQQ